MNKVADIFEGESLNPSTAPGYGQAPIPSDRDIQITQMLNHWLALDEVNRRRAEHSLGEENLEILEVYAERMASLAVRSGDRALLHSGLTALGLRRGEGDWRVGVTIMALLYDAAERLSMNPVEAFEVAARGLSQAGAESLSRFCKRKPEDRSLAAMLYRTGSDPDGFRYIREW